MRRLAYLLPFLLLVAPAAAQDPAPDSRGEAFAPKPEYRGTRAAAPIPAQYHLRNEGGSDGAGLCVIASIVANGQYQGVPGIVDSPGVGASNVPGQSGRVDDAPGKGSILWTTARRRPGGYSPGKLAGLVKEVLPNEQYVSLYTEDPSKLYTLSAEGYPLGVTMNTGRFYGYRRIAHMVSAAHVSPTWACIVDNNNPGIFSWMPTPEFLRRWKDGGYGWAFAWTRKGGMMLRSAPAATWLPALLLAAAAVLILPAPRRGNS